METAPVLGSKETELLQRINNTECEGVGNIIGLQCINIFCEGSLRAVVEERADV